MTGVKAGELSLDEWHEVLAPYGYADIRARHSWAGPAIEYEIHMMLAPSPGGELGEWAERSYLLEQAKQAVEAVRGKGFVLLEDAPHIEFGGRYMYRVGEPAHSWMAEASLRFTCRHASRVAR